MTGRERVLDSAIAWYATNLAKANTDFNKIARVNTIAVISVRRLKSGFHCVYKKVCMRNW